MAGHPGSLDDARRIGGRTARARRALKHRTMSRAPAAESMPLNESRKAAALGGSHDVYQIVFSKDVHKDLIAHVGRFFPTVQAHLAQNPSGRKARALEMPFGGLVHAARGFFFDQA